MSGAIDIVVAARAALADIKRSRNSLVDCHCVYRNGKPDMRTLPRALRAEVARLDALIEAVEADGRSVRQVLAEGNWG